MEGMSVKLKSLCVSCMTLKKIANNICLLQKSEEKHSKREEEKKAHIKERAKCRRSAKYLRKWLYLDPVVNKDNSFLMY